MSRLRKVNWLKWLTILLVVCAIAGAILFPIWNSTVDRNRRRQAAEPFRIAGNLYFVGGSENSSFLITGPDGDVLIDSGHTGIADMITTSIATLGFDIRDVKILLNSSPYGDHAGGIAAGVRCAVVDQ